MSAWRARAFHLTRNRAFLGRAVAVILGVSALVAAVLHVSRLGGDKTTTTEGFGESFETSLRESAKRLEALSEPAPARLIGWIREAAALWMIEDVPLKRGFDAVALRLEGMELHPLISKHTTSEKQADAVAAYARFRFLPEGDARASAFHFLEEAAKDAAPPFANEMLGDALVLSDRREEALQAYLREVSNPAATHSRKRAFDLALVQENSEVVGHLSADPRLLKEVDPISLWKAAKLTGDRGLLFRALWQMQWARWMQGAAVPLALLGAAIWYIILVHTASREAMRWWRYLPGVFAGVASVWLLHWWQGTLDYARDPSDAPSLTHEVLEWVMHVGLPEETAKLIMFAFFLPVLLHHRSGLKAALTAGCVGLGFALDENLHYFRDHGPQIAIARLLKANFMHISLTGIVGWHLYELFRTRFHHATEFLTAFCLVVAAHGLYDFGLGDAAVTWGFDIASIIILALAARSYFQLLHQQEDIKPAGYAISRTAVFLFGTALLGGILMVVMVWERHKLDGITLVLRQMVAVALVALVYIREWRELE